MLKPTRIPSPIRRIVALIAATLLLAAAPTLGSDEPLPETLLNPTQVEAISIDDFHRVLESHQGKVIVINFWATWCIPCVQELPELNELQKRFRDKGLMVIAVSLDDQDKLEDSVRSFFAKRAPDLISYLSTEEEPSDFVGSLDPEWLGALPSTYFLNGSGEVKKGATGRLSYQRFEELVTEMLAKEKEAAAGD